MKFYKIVLWKAYFDKGWGLMNYPKYAIFLIGAGDVIKNNGDYTNIIIGTFCVAIFCFLFGKWAYSSGWVSAEEEVRNKIDPFVREIRKKFGITNN